MDHFDGIRFDSGSLKHISHMQISWLVFNIKDSFETNNGRHKLNRAHGTSSKCVLDTQKKDKINPVKAILDDGNRIHFGYTSFC